MDFGEFSKKVKSDTIGGAYLLHGGEEYIKDLAVKTVTKKYVAQGLKDINYDKIDCAERDISDIEKAIIQLPFMSPKRVVTVYSLALFKMSATQLKQSGNAKTIETIKKIIKQCPQETVLLFAARGQVSSALVKVFAADKRDVEFKPPKASQKGQYVARMARDADLDVSSSVINMLIEYTGMELLELEGEILKLKAYAANEKVTQEDIEKVCTAAVEYNVFKMLKLIAAKDGARAIAEYRKLILSGQSPQAVISMIERQFRALFYIDEIKSAGKSNYKDIANKLSTKDFVIRNMEQTARHLSKEKIKKIAKWCADADYLVKRGKISADNSAEMLIVRLMDV